jgi:DinB superfamily
MDYAADMTTTTIDPFLLDATEDAWARPLPADLAAARTEVVAAARDLLDIPEAALVKPWAWKGGSEEEVRYGAYRAAEALELAELEARAMLGPSEAREREAARRIGPLTATRWDLHGVLLPLDDALLDADPGGGEWSIRLTLGHVIAGQRGYGWGSAWWQGQGYAADDPALPARAPESLWEDLPDEATTEAEGTVEELRARLDHVCDMTVERLAGMPDDRVDAGARWAGFSVTIGFRFGRWSSHVREHTIQVEKTFAMLGHEPDEPARLVRNLLAAYGRAESAVYGRAGTDDAVARILAGAREARAATSAARDAAESR